MNAELSDILLVQVPPWGTTTPPLGIASIAAYVRSCGMAARVYDANIKLFSVLSDEERACWRVDAFEFWSSGEALKALSAPLDQLCAQICAEAGTARVVGFSVTFASIPVLNMLLERLKILWPEVKVIVGGGAVSFRQNRDQMRGELIDFFVIGEGEEPIVRLLQSVRANAAPSGVVIEKDAPENHAVLVRSQGGFDINTLPTVTFEGFDLDAYTEKDLLPISISRGCVNACNFCCDWAVKRPFRARRAELVAQDIETLVTRYHRRRLEFCDLLINGDLKQLERFCDLLIERKVDAVWGGQLTVRADMTQALFDKMKRAGCGGLTFGVETFSDALLVKMKKRFKVAEAQAVLARAKNAGMRTELNLIVGFPGEEDADVEATADFLKKHRALIDRVNSLNICSIGPGMPVWDEAEKFGINKDEITDWYAWHTKDMTNTIEIRHARHARLKKVVADQGFECGWENIRKEAVMVSEPKPAQRASGDDVPNMCILLVTLGCNLRCKMCYLWTNKEDRSRVPEMGQWKKFMDSMKAMMPADKTIVFGGGEPLLYLEDLLELIRHAKTNGFRVSLATSGYLLDENVARQLAEAGVDFLALTVYSLNPWTHDGLRGMRGSLDRVKRAIRYLERVAPRIEIAIDTVLMQPNMNDVLALARWVEKTRSLTRIMYQVIMQPFHTPPKDRWFDEKSYASLWPRDIRRMNTVIDGLIAFKQKTQARTGHSKISNSLAQFQAFKRYFDAPESFIKKGVCPVATSRQLVVTPYGEIGLCPYMPPIGTIEDGSLEALWHAPLAEEQRRAIAGCTKNCHHILNCSYEDEPQAVS